MLEIMRTIIGSIMLLGALGLAGWSFQQGILYKQCGCGCCGGIEVTPNYPTMYFWDEHKNIEDMPYVYCSLVGCSAPRVPLFVDLYGVAGVLGLLGLLVLFKNDSVVV
jgi:hypothetical protein